MSEVLDMVVPPMPVVDDTPVSVSVAHLDILLTASGVPVVSDIAFDLRAGDVLGIVGESGSGKTTLSMALLGYFRRGTRVAPHAQIRVGGQDVLALEGHGRGTLVSYVPQDPSASLNPAITIEAQLLEGLVYGPAAIARSEALQRIKGLLSEVQLPVDKAFLGSYPAQLSGGQQQRVAIAIALASHPRLVVLDEPTTGLDVSTQMEVLRLVTRVCKAHSVAAIYVSHDLGVVSHVADQVLVLYSGRIVEYGSREAVFSRPAHPYTRALLEALPTVSERRMLTPISGSAPALEARAAGCAFRERCRYAAPACSTLPPLSRPGGPASQLVSCHFPCGEKDARPSAAIAPTGKDVQEQPVFSVQALSAWYGAKQVLHGVHLDLHRGECVSVVGESGSGKSTFGRCLIGLHSHCTGAVTLHPGGADGPTYRVGDAQYRRRVQYIFQNPYGSLNPRRTIGDSIAVVVGHFFGAQASGSRQTVLDALSRVGLPAHFIDRYPNELSGGEKQRVAIARALVCQPQVLVCDEITSALDVSVQAAIIELLRSLMQDGLALLFVTHNLAVVRSLSDRVAVLHEGRVAELGYSEEVLTHPADAYTRQLLSHTLELKHA